MKKLALLALLMSPAASLAVPIQWTLDGFLMQFSQPGGTAGGSFIYDSDSGDFSDISLFTSGTSSGGLTFTTLAGQSPDGLIFYQDGATGAESTIAFQLNGIFRSMLTNDGGVLIVNPSTSFAFFAEFRCGGASNCTLGNGSAVSNWNAFGETPSTLTGSPISSVNEPGTLGLLAAATFLALFMRRRREKHQ